MIQYDVLIPTSHGELRVDAVFYNAPQDPDDVRRSLVNHDGYDARIIVREHDDRELIREASHATVNRITGRA